jgi:hypothetical protein
MKLQECVPASGQPAQPPYRPLAVAANRRAPRLLALPSFLTMEQRPGGSPAGNFRFPEAGSGASLPEPEAATERAQPREPRRCRSPHRSRGRRARPPSPWPRGGRADDGEQVGSEAARERRRANWGSRRIAAGRGRRDWSRELGLWACGEVIDRVRVVSANDIWGPHVIAGSAGYRGRVWHPRTRLR